MKPGLYKAHGGHMMIVTSVARKYLRTIRIVASELQVRKETEGQLLKDGYEPCANPPLLVAIEKFAAVMGGVSEAAKAALSNLKELNMDVKTATTAELISFFNKHSEKPVKKFADRGTAEKRVQAILDSMAVKQEAKEEKTANKARVAKAKGAPKEKAERQLMSTCYVTVVDDKGTRGDKAEFRSVKMAFEHFKFPTRAGKFRTELKREGKKVYEHNGKKYEFTV